MKTIGLLQPVFLPWMGYFEQMAYVDQFILMDDVQYTKHDWRNRNRIKTANGSIWLTVPIRNHRLATPVKDIEINYSSNWLEKLLKAIAQNYGKTPYFQPLFREIETELRSKPALLIDLTCQLIKLLCTYLDISTSTSFSSEARVGSIGATNRVLEICKFFKADVLYNGASSANYMEIEKLHRAGIDVVFQDYVHPVYPQCYGEFRSHQSVLDLIMNTGPKASKILRSSPMPALLRQVDFGLPNRRYAA